MKKYNGFGVMHKDTYVMRYMSGVPATERRQYWWRSPWSAVRLVLHQI